MNKLQTYFQNRRSFLVVLICVLAVYGLSFYQRHSGYAYWIANSQEYVVDDVFAMSTLDAYYWLEMAKELDKGTLGKGQPDPTKSYPDLAPFAIKDKPGLLAEFISLAKNLTSGNYYRSGLMLIPILAGLFVFPLFYYFNKLGFGASAVLGGLVGSFSHAYYDRTMMGRVDTDLLNTFFPIATACFILSMNKDKSRFANLGLALGAGLTMYLFNWWYQQPMFILLFLFFMAVHLVVGRVVDWKYLVPILLIFPLASGPGYALQIFDSLRTFLWTYISPPATGQIVWPNVMNTIAEARSRGITINLEMLHGFLPMVAAGFAGLVYLYVRRFRQMIPITPLVVLGAWSMVGPTRFAMYMAPLIGVGAGVLIEVLVKYAGGRIRLLKPAVPLVGIALMFTLFFSTSAYTGYSFNVAPILKASTTRALLDIERIVPRHSAMFTPFWEFGYPLMNIGEFATYHDGGTQGGIRTTLAAKAMTSTDQKEMVSLLAYLEENGFVPLTQSIWQDKLSADKMLELVFDYPGDFRGENVHILYLEDMIWKFPSISVLGTWDFDRQQSSPMDYVQLNCFSMADNVMKCMDGTIDLNRGFMNDGTVDIPLRGALFVNNGYVVSERRYGTREGYYLQVLMKNNRTFMILVADERLFRTNFNQQFLLGRYDRRYFEEVYNNYPVARVLKVRKAKSDDPVR
ncbi:STT3 domain-containing protein [Desulfuromonas sp. TF]|uniref:STT3 domain-containing protein n=1 Tax=Desulfuromonas sp. TF TaxID=1232410 RepID=UPI00138AF2A1|nr:STT3 domain-containing protein [Desulfuromonas sp. TF]